MAGLKSRPFKAGFGEIQSGIWCGSRRDLVWFKAGFGVGVRWKGRL